MIGVYCPQSRDSWCLEKPFFGGGHNLMGSRIAKNDGCQHSNDLCCIYPPTQTSMFAMFSLMHKIRREGKKVEKWLRGLTGSIVAHLPIN